MSAQRPREPIPPFHNRLLIQQLRHVLAELHKTPYPEVASPPALPKRASVALIIRVQPHYQHWPPAEPLETLPDDTTQDRLDDFFAQTWVQNGDPEVLFIKRAARQGDKWTGHIALPGGRRDPEDADDMAAAVRETLEEVGLDLNGQVALQVGNLPQKVITMAWGKTPLLVLCPYVFLLTTNTVPPLRLQPTEVASAHWVPVRALLAPSQKTYWYQDVSSRTAKQEFGLRRWFHRAMTGRMMFAAVRLIPSESHYCSNIVEFMPHPKEPAGSSTTSKRVLNCTVPLLGAGKDAAPSPVDVPLLLWGLTLGVMADFLDLIPTEPCLGLWVYPTFTPLDLRFVLWLLSFNFRRQRQRQFEQGHRTDTPPAVELGMDSIAMRHDKDDQTTDGDVDMKLAARTQQWNVGQKGSRSEFVNTMLDGYYNIIRRAVIVTVAGRFAAVLATLYFVIKRVKR